MEKKIWTPCECEVMGQIATLIYLNTKGTGTFHDVPVNAEREFETC